jgi:hypothetical protein
VTTITVRGPISTFWRALLAAALLSGGAAWAEPEEEDLGAEPLTEFERTPPRLSLADGEVSFWRPGAEDWAPARVNVALAPGDQLWAGDDSNLEIEIGSSAFVRAGEETELGFVTQEPDYLQFRVGSGTASLDLRRLPAGHTVELATPHAAFTIERTGYYRVEVEDGATKLTARRGGLATLTPANGPAVEVAPSEQVIVSGDPEEAPQIETYAAPELDDWDNWNYRRTDRQLDALSARYVSDDVQGLSDLDQHGSWRRVETYGPVWIPRAVPVGWAPYSHGRWMWDAGYGWTWVDDAPWGWAPFHYGRWVHVHGHWAWAPGPIVVRTYYAPALVAFYGTPHVSVRIAFGSPSVAWVPLGWGEPCVPWWGRSHFRGRPHWVGWGGPRVVNKVVIKNKTVIHAKDIRVYENEHVRGAFTAVKRKEFGRKHVREARLDDAKRDRFERVRGELPVEASRESFASDGRKGRRPPERVLERRVVATRTERAAARAEKAELRAEKKSAKAGREIARAGSPPEPLLVPAPSKGSRRERALERPPFGQAGEERSKPKAPPRFEQVKRSAEKAREKKAQEARVRGTAPPVPAAQDAVETPTAKLERSARGERSERRESRVEPPAREDRGSEGSEARRASPPPREERREARTEERSNARARERAAEAPRRERASPPEDLPGEPANRVYRERPERQARVEPRVERQAQRAERRDARSAERAQQQAEREQQKATRAEQKAERRQGR